MNHVPSFHDRIAAALLPSVDVSLDRAVETKRARLSNVDALLPMVVQLEELNAAFTIEWRKVLSRVQEMAWEQADETADHVIERLLADEKAAAGVLKGFQRKASRLLKKAAPDVAGALRRADEALVRRCELLRDARWELMVARAGQRPAEAAVPLDLDQLRKAVGLA